MNLKVVDQSSCTRNCPSCSHDAITDCPAAGNSAITNCVVDSRSSESRVEAEHGTKDTFILRLVAAAQRPERQLAKDCPITVLIQIHTDIAEWLTKGSSQGLHRFPVCRLGWCSHVVYHLVVHMQGDTRIVLVEYRLSRLARIPLRNDLDPPYVPFAAMELVVDNRPDHILLCNHARDNMRVRPLATRNSVRSLHASSKLPLCAS